MQSNNVIPQTGFLRLPQIVGDSKANPPIPPLVPVSKATWWAWCAAGKAPKPYKIGERVTVWKAEDIRAFIEQGGKGGAA